MQSSDVLDLLVPILHYLNDARADQARVGLMHIGEDFLMKTMKLMTVSMVVMMMMIIIIMMMMMPGLTRLGPTRSWVGLMHIMCSSWMRLLGKIIDRNQSFFRGFHTSSSEWGEELWSAIKQGLNLI